MYILDTFFILSKQRLKIVCHQPIEIKRQAENVSSGILLELYLNIITLLS